MNAPAHAFARARKLSHVEFVYPPGERALVGRLFALLGVEVQDVMEGRYFVGMIDPASFDPADNENYVAGSQVLPEQWAFDQELKRALHEGELAESFATHQAQIDRYPQSGMHFGIDFATVGEWEAAIDRISRVAELAPELAGRVRLCGVFRPGEPGSVASIHQAFLWTDVVASGSLAFGQRIELSAH